MVRTTFAVVSPKERPDQNWALSPLQHLQGLVLTPTIWADRFSVDGKISVQRVKDLIPRCRPDAVATLALTARDVPSLQHMALFVARELVRHPFVKNYPGLVRQTVCQVMRRPDDLCVFLELYWQDGRQPLANAVKRGLADAFTSFDAAVLVDNNGTDAIMLRDVLFLTHARPRDEAQARVFRQLIDRTL